MLTLTDSQLPNLLVGAQILGGGGGGRGELLVSLVRKEIRRNGPITILSPDDLDADDFCLPVAQIGSSTIRSERLPTGDELPRLLATVEAQQQRKVAALTWLEAAGGNAFVPLLAAAQLGLPVVDVDGMGRAFSVIVQTSYEVSGIPAAPVTLSGQNGQVVTVQAAADQLEDLVRPVVNALGGWAFAGWYGQSAAQLRTSGMPGTIGYALRLGETVSMLTDSGPHQLATAIRARLLLSGQVQSVTGDGTGSRSIVVHADGPPERSLRLEARNEVLMALLDGRIVSTVPEIICPFSRELVRPVNVEDIHLGQPLDVVVLPAPARWREADALRRVGPRSHGYLVEPVSAFDHGETA